MEQRRFTEVTEEFKHEAVRLARWPGASNAGIAKDLGISSNVLSRWTREFENKVSKVARGKNESISSKAFDRMRRERAKVRTERDIL